MAKGKKKESKEKKEAKKQRQLEKQAKQGKKKAAKDAKDAGEEDIEAILAEILKKEAQKTAVQVIDCAGPPPPRANFTLTGVPSGDMIMFGGEYYDGECNTVYNEVYRWNIEKNEWKMISSPNTPGPRCSHQAVAYRDHLYIFGGEFATVDQFYHYRDLWRLDLKTNAWECIESKGGPSPRSGHRMVVWRNYLVLFGGFYEAFRETKWFNDLYLFSLTDLKWKKIEFPTHRQQPSPRSGCQLALHHSDDSVFLYGGYAKVKVAGEKAEGKVYSDCWQLNLAPVLKGGQPTWEKIRGKGSAPTPRSGGTMTVFKNRALLFGGVTDEEGPRHTIRSTFYNELYAFDMDRKRWFQLGLRKKKAGGRRRKRGKKEGKAEADEQEDYSDDEDMAEGEEEEQDEEEDAIDEADKKFAYVDHQGQLIYVDDEEEEEEKKEEEEEKKEEDDEISASSTRDSMAEVSSSKIYHNYLQGLEGSTVEKNVLSNRLLVDAPQSSAENDLQAVDDIADGPVVQIEETPAPLPRINPALIIRGNDLYVYGGVLEDGDREITLDDCWRLNLNKLESWDTILEGTMSEQQWKGELDDGSSMASDDEGEGEEDDEDEDDDEEELYRNLEEQQEEDFSEGATAEMEKAAFEEEERTEKKKKKEKGIAAAMAALGLEGAEDGEDEEEDQEGKDLSKAKKKKKSSKGKSSKSDRHTRRAEIETLRAQLDIDDSNRTPQIGENLRDFFARTSAYWSAEAAKDLRSDERLGEKELKRKGFSLAGERFEELRPLLDRLNELEREQLEAEEEAAKARGASKRPGTGGRR